MRKILTSSLLTASLLFSATAFAKSFGYSSTITEPLASAVKIEIGLSEDLAHRANNLPKSIGDRSGSLRLNSGFANNGYYGDKDLDLLKKRLQSKIEKRFSKKGIVISENASTILRVTLADAKPNRPTFEQQSRDVSLSFQSIALGGAEIESELVTRDGRSLGNINYRWYENDIRDASFGSTWSDTYRAFDRYASRAAKVLSN